MATLPALIPEIPSIDETLPALQPPALDWTALRASVQGVTGKSLVELADVDKILAEMELQKLRDEDAQLRDYPAQYKRWWETDALFPVPIPALGATLQLPVGKIIALGKALNQVRIEIEHRCEAERAKREVIFSDQQAIVRQRIREEAARREAEQNAKAAAEKQAELDRAQREREAAVEAGTPDEEVAAIDAHIEDVRAAPIVMPAVNQRQVEQDIFQAPKGLSSTKVVLRRVKRDKQGRIIVAELRAFFAHLAGEIGSTRIAQLVRVTEPARTSSDTISISFAKMNNDLTTELPGIKNESDTRSRNYGK